MSFKRYSQPVDGDVVQSNEKQVQILRQTTYERFDSRYCTTASFDVFSALDHSSSIEFSVSLNALSATVAAGGGGGGGGGGSLPASYGVFTASINTFSASVKSFSGSVNAFTASANSSFLALSAFTASDSAFTASVNAFSSSFYSFSGSVKTFTASLNAFSASISAFTASVNSFSASLYSFSASVNAYTASITYPILDKHYVTSSLYTNTVVVSMVTQSLDTRYGQAITGYGNAIPYFNLGGTTLFSALQFTWDNTRRNQIITGSQDIYSYPDLPSAIGSQRTLWNIFLRTGT